MSIVHIHAPEPEAKCVRWDTCSDCKRRAPFVILLYAWYGATSTCLRCGRQWQDGEWMPLDWRRGVREDNKAEARREWKRMRTTKVAP